MADFNFIDLGLKDYLECWNLQEELLAKIVNRKRSEAGTVSENYFLLTEHPHVYTLGKSGNEKNLLTNIDFLRNINASYYKINRGGDITYHGPGQLVGYPIIDLEFYKIGIHEYINRMEDAIIATIAEYGLQGTRKQGAAGVWLDAGNEQKARKICAIGVRVSRGVTMHGFALNVNTDMHYFDHINPCGFSTYSATSIQKEVDTTISMPEVKRIISKHFNRIY